jgi:hypothetical protein
MTDNKTADPRLAAAAAWLMSDDSLYEAHPDAAIKAAKGMLDAADRVDPLRQGDQNGQ